MMPTMFKMTMMTMMMMAGVFGGMGSEDNVEQFTYTAEQLNTHGLAYLHIMDGLGESTILMISVMVVLVIRSLVLHISNGEIISLSGISGAVHVHGRAAQHPRPRLPPHHGRAR
jgi:hypothetical protein